MAAPFRIERKDVGVRAVAAEGGGGEALKFYLEKLLKMIPAEVVGLYMIGNGLIPKGNNVALVIWSVVCLIGVFVVRGYGTADKAEGKRADWTMVIISAIAFVIWLYNLGGPFAAYPGVHQPYIGSLLVLVWTFFIPYIYKGAKD
jgi:hypothetical protein